MYATLSYDVTAGATPIEAVRNKIIDVFRERATCDLLSDTFICEVKNTSDYLAVVKTLNKVGTDHDGQFQFVFTLHSTGDPLRSNAPFPKSKAKSIIEP